MYSILLVDDDKEVLSINLKYFKQLNYDVHTAFNAQSAIKMLKDYTPDCIVMDVMMPGIDGFTACERIKTTCKAPIIFLTGKDSEDDKIHGLLLGADDYMIKPYSLRELEARIQVLIRRYQATSNETTNNTLCFPPLTIDVSRHKTFFEENEEISLSNKEFDFLYLLASSPNRIYTFEEIGQEIWGGYLESDRKTIMVTASRLRKKLAVYPQMEDMIETVWSKGYQFIGKRG